MVRRGWGLFGSYAYRLPWGSSRVWWTIMQVLLQLVCVVWFVGSPASVSGSPGGGILSPPHLSGRWLSTTACRPGGYSTAICSMWSLSSLYCSGEEREKGSGKLLNHPNHAPSLQNPRKKMKIKMHIPQTLPYLHPSCRWSPASSGSHCRASC